MNELPIVVTCTDRKTHPPDPFLQARNLPETHLAGRVDHWAGHLAAARGALRELADLYQGDQWHRAQALAGAATRAGFTPRLYVASAGLGLSPVSRPAPSYSATFAPRHADSVASSITEAADWWDHLQRLQGAPNLSDLAGRHGGRILLVLSETYAQAMHRELTALAAEGYDSVLIGGARDIAGITRIPANSGLRRALGGTLTSLNTRTAAAWLEHCTPGALLTPAAMDRWNAWVEQTAVPESYARTPMTDEEVIAFIREKCATLQPAPSRTRLLRMLRADNKACEQKRFADLYTRTMECR
ncbi:hypothetical protein [Streptomyces californicus]|uniref:hypothetical protein n=1 Tax=Streptomyces californicus TaxID=67351 RepID=UPI0037FA72DF